MFKWNQTITVVLVLGWLLCAWDLARHHYKTQTGLLVLEKTTEGRRQVRDMAELIRKNIRYFHGIPVMLAGEPMIKRALAGGGSNSMSALVPGPANGGGQAAGSRSADLDDFLKNVKNTLGPDVAWVMDTNGICIAASNSGETNGFVGADFSDRDFFREARQPKPGQQYGFGRRTHIPGLYFGAPVLSNGKFVGAVAVKMNMDNLTNWVDVNDAFLVDGFGVIIQANNQTLLMHAVTQDRIGRLSPSRREERYHRESFPPLAIEPWVSTNQGQLF